MLLRPECVSPNSQVEILTPNEIVLGGGGLWVLIRFWGGAHMKGISALLKKEVRESSWPLLLCGHSYIKRWEAGSHQTLYQLDLGFPASRTVRMDFFCL